MVEAVTEFNKKNSTYPHRIIIYRDGVGDSQKSIVLNYEVPQI